MKSVLSLRSRVLLGAVLWTMGLFAIAGTLTTAMMLRYPSSPRVLHKIFFHAAAVSAVALLCMLAGLWHVRRGLSPIDQLRARLSAVRDGRERRLSGTYPAEVQPLVDDLNGLLDDREQRVTRALVKAGDLAHGLKTPLAVLAHEAERADAAGQGDLAATIAQQVDRMRGQIDHHLAHARAAVSGATPGARCSAKESADALARTLGHLHADRGVTIDVRVASSQLVRGRREDLDEMLGNLLDNACHRAGSRIVVGATDQEGRIVITVEDDGAGLAPDMWETVLQRGVRADEAAPGSGFGLAIVRELAELYGGSIALDASPLGGLRARLTLPAG